MLAGGSCPMPKKQIKNNELKSINQNNKKI
jgi:hypothetical protein